MSDMWILAGDIGTSSVKTAIFDQHGRIVDSAVQAHATSHEHNGWASQDAETWWQGFTANVRILLERHPEARERIAVIGASGHMLGCLPVDGKGRPLYSAIIHADTRASDQARFIEKHVGAEPLYALTGNTLNARSGICKILWLKDHEPELYRKTARFLQSKDYLVSRLTGNPDTTDLSDASHAQWINLASRTYLTDVFSELGLDSGKMPALHRGTDIIGALTPESGRELGLPAGIPVIAGAGDGACSSVGAGSALSGDFYCCLGTSAWIAYASPQPLFDPQRRLFNILSADGKTCGVYGTVQSAGHSVSWAMNLFQETDAQAFDRNADTVPAGSEGLIFLPYLDGERAAINDTQARGIFFGMSSDHNQAHFKRAVLEGVAFSLRSIIQMYRETMDLKIMRLIGGGAKSDLWSAIIADACGVTIDRLTTPAGDATALGIALAAGVGAGLYPDMQTALQTISVRDRRMADPERQKTYDRLFPIFESLYGANRSLFGRLAQFRQEGGAAGHAKG